MVVEFGASHGLVIGPYFYGVLIKTHWVNKLNTDKYENLPPMYVQHFSSFVYI